MQHSTPANHPPSETRLISIVAPAYNEAENLPHLYARVRDTMEALGRSYELIIVENGSTDDSLAILQQLHQLDNRLHYVSLSRNFGHQGALFAGLEYSRGAAVISMDADLQHPPELIPKMIQLWEAGYDVVYTIKQRDTTQSLARRCMNSLFYNTMSYLSGLELSSGQSDFCLLDRKTVEAIYQLPERQKFLRGLVKWIGFRQIGIEYSPGHRVAGESKFHFTHLLKFALDGIFSFSIVPLRMFTLLGILVATGALGHGLFTIGLGLYALVTGLYQSLPSGWVTIASAIFFLGGIQLIGIGLLGEYIGRIYDETKQRPVYLVREHSLPVPETSEPPLTRRSGLSTAHRTGREGW